MALYSFPFQVFTVTRKVEETKGVIRSRKSKDMQYNGKQAQEATVLIDTTLQEKNITYPTDAKLAIKII
jgi:hypothetical protein